MVARRARERVPANTPALALAQEKTKVPGPTLLLPQFCESPSPASFAAWRSYYGGAWFSWAHRPWWSRLLPGKNRRFSEACLIGFVAVKLRREAKSGTGRCRNHWTA